MYIFKRLSTQSEVCNCTVSHGFSIFHAKRDPPHINSCLRDKTRSVIVLFHMSFRLSTQSEVHPTPTSAYGTKRDLTYKNCFINNFLTNNERLEKFLKVKVDIDQSKVTWSGLCKDLPKLI